MLVNDMFKIPKDQGKFLIELDSELYKFNTDILYLNRVIKVDQKIRKNEYITKTCVIIDINNDMNNTVLTLKNTENDNLGVISTYDVLKGDIKIVV